MLDGARGSLCNELSIIWSSNKPCPLVSGWWACCHFAAARLLGGAACGRPDNPGQCTLALKVGLLFSVHVEEDAEEAEYNCDAKREKREGVGADQLGEGDYWRPVRG